jgi:hypothetical protein
MEPPLQSPSGSFRTWAGVLSRIESERVEYITTDAEWDRLWKEHAGETIKPKIDFERSSVVAYFLGASPSAHYVHLESITVSTSGASAVFKTSYSDAFDSNFLFPFAISEIPRQRSGLSIIKSWTQAMSYTPGPHSRVMGTFDAHGGRL